MSLSEYIDLPVPDTIATEDEQTLVKPPWKEPNTATPLTPQSKVWIPVKQGTPSQGTLRDFLQDAQKASPLRASSSRDSLGSTGSQSMTPMKPEGQPRSTPSPNTTSRTTQAVHGESEGVETGRSVVSRGRAASGTGSECGVGTLEKDELESCLAVASALEALIESMYCILCAQ